ncbi:glycosyltransferase family A protein [Kamptonema cortianum]|nr:glycosyltransferase family A protein [Geitlerinema splendidum]MDK3156840.1 glycosyltransferase family A protein [Kamptonema cortianum]
MTTPRVSFVIPAYNPGYFLEETLQSVLAQTDSDWEAVVVDDGSTEWPDAPSLSDSRVRLFRIRDCGVSGARNYGAAQARGEFLCYLDADDLIDPNFLESLLPPLLEDPELAGAYCDGKLLWMFESPESGNTDMIYGPSENLFEALTVRPMNLGAILLRREKVAHAGGFDLALTSASEDWDFLLKAAWETNWAYIPSQLYTYRLTAGSWSRNYERLYRLTDDMLRRYGSSDTGPRLSKQQFRAAKHHLRNWAAREMRNQVRSGQAGARDKAIRTLRHHPELIFWFLLRMVRR